MVRLFRSTSAAVVLIGVLVPAPCRSGHERPFDRDLRIPPPLSVLQGRDVFEGLEGRPVPEMEFRSVQRQVDDTIFAEAGGMAATLLRRPLSWRSWVGHPLSTTRRPQKGRTATARAVATIAMLVSTAARVSHSPSSGVVSLAWSSSFLPR